MVEKNLISLYLKDIGEFDILSKEREYELLKRVKAGDLEAKNEIIHSNLRLVVNVAKNYYSKNMSFIDLISEGNIGLIRAIEKFDLNKSNRFSTYAVWWIKQAIGKAIITKGRDIRIPTYKHELLNKVNKYLINTSMIRGATPTAAEIAKELGIEEKKIEKLMDEFKEVISLNSTIGNDIYLEDTLSISSIENMEENLIEKINIEDINKKIKELTIREQEVLTLRYGLKGEDKYTLEEIGKNLNLTRERVRQIEKKSLEKLKNKYLSS